MYWSDICPHFPRISVTENAAFMGNTSGWNKWWSSFKVHVCTSAVSACHTQSWLLLLLWSQLCFSLLISGFSGSRFWQRCFRDVNTDCGVVWARPVINVRLALLFQMSCIPPTCLRLLGTLWNAAVIKMSGRCVGCNLISWVQKETTNVTRHVSRGKYCILKLYWVAQQKNFTEDVKDKEGTGEQWISGRIQPSQSQLSWGESWSLLWPLAQQEMTSASLQFT